VVDVELSVDSVEPDVLAAIEQAAEAQGIELVRVAEAE